MTEAEKTEISQVLQRLYEKTFEVTAMMKDGKFIVAYEKLGGVLKVINQLANKVASTETSSESSVE